MTTAEVADDLERHIAREAGLCSRCDAPAVVSKDDTITGTDLPCTQCNATPHVEPDVTVTDAVVKALWEEFAPNLPGYITYGDIQTVAYDALRAQAGEP